MLFWQVPLPEQTGFPGHFPGVIFSKQSFPPYPSLHTHTPLTHLPLFEQGGTPGQFFVLLIEQSFPE
jgi:hypothetical protein